MGPVQYRGFTIHPHGRRWRVQVRPRAIVRDTIEAAKEALDALIADRNYESVVARADVARAVPGPLTVGELCDAWFTWKTSPDCDEPIRPRTKRDYRRAIDFHIKPLIGDRDAATISTVDLKRDFVRVCTSKTFLRFSRTVLKQTFRWALEDRLVARPDNPCNELRIARRSVADGRDRKLASVKAVTDDQIPSPDEIQKMLMWAVETGRPEWWLFVYIQATLGLRPSEVCALRVEDFDFDRHVVRIERAAPARADPTDWAPKTETSRRDIKVGPHFFDAIAERLPSEGWLFDARARGGGRPQRTHTATPCWPPDAPNREMRKMRRALGLSERYTPYSLRHFVATRLIVQGKEEIQVAKFLGTSVEMLQKVYANHLDHAAQRDIGIAVTELF